MIYGIFTIMVVKFTTGAMFDFHLVETVVNYVKHKSNCRDIGYDGLAVISTPEALVYALKLAR